MHMEFTKNVPVLVRDFTYNLDADVDYIEFP